MTRSAVRAWFLVHKWSGIISTGFLLMLCLTGLPLIFHDEIDQLTESGSAAQMEGRASSAGGLPLDRMLATALAQRPGEVPLFMAFDNASPLLTITTGPMPQAGEDEMTIQIFNRATGELAGRVEDSGVMHFILQLHIDMFAGLPGMLFLGSMGLLFVIAIISGTVLYAPFMRKLAFGTVRTGRSTRVKWLDYHNMLGIITLAWASVVGLTGVINTLATPIVETWQMDELSKMTEHYADKIPLAPEKYSSLDEAMTMAKMAQPGNNPQFIAFPGGSFSSAHHYAVFFQGATPLTEHLLTPALIDAQTGELTDIRPLPWQVQALLLSRPLHFGDYGGLPLKLLWALLDILTILVLGSGLYLWLGKGRASTKSQIIEIENGGLAPETMPT
jgi:uncharacterized iron-regulated membrane protein